jgi:hypothetical protein
LKLEWRTGLGEAVATRFRIGGGEGASGEEDAGTSGDARDIKTRPTL